MKKLSEFSGKINFLLTDIDDTLTDEGLLGPEAYAALWSLHKSGIKVIPVTGRPAGWCELIARMWPVAGVIGENGGLYFRYADKKMQRYFVVPESQQQENRKKLNIIQTEILSQIPGSGIASDQFCRVFDLAIDFCEDVPRLPATSVDNIVEVFHKHGAQAKVSSIHVNGWFGNYDKLTTALVFLQREFHVDSQAAKLKCAFSGDSPNDEPMFEFFPNSFAVANISEFSTKIKSLPQYVSSQRGGLGFAEIAKSLLK